MRRRFLTGLVVLFVAIGILPSLASAQIPALDSAASGANRSGLEISPAIFEQILEPGKSYSQKIEIKNITSDYLLLSTTTKSLVPYEDTLNKDDLNRFNAASWIDVKDPDFILPPGKQRTVSMTINTPKDAEAGGHYATIVFEPQLPQRQREENTTTAVSVPNIAAIAFFNVPGDINEELTYGDETPVPFLSFGSTVNIPIKLDNVGNVHVVPRTTATVRNIFGKTVQQIMVDPRIVLPNTQRVFDAEWYRGLRLGIYSVEIKTDYGTPNQTITTGKNYTVALLNLPLFLMLLVVIALFIFSLRTRHRWGSAWRTLKGDVYHAGRDIEKIASKDIKKIEKKSQKWRKLWKKSLKK